MLASAGAGERPAGQGRVMDRFYLAAQVGGGVSTDHAVAVLDESADVAVSTALRGGHRNRGTVCGRRSAVPHGRIFDATSPRACRRCVTLSGGST